MAAGKATLISAHTFTILGRLWPCSGGEAVWLDQAEVT